MDEQYYTVQEVADLFKVKKGAVYKWMRQRKLKFVLVGGERRVTGTDLRDFVKPGVIDDESYEKEGNLTPCLAAA